MSHTPQLPQQLIDSSTDIINKQYQGDINRFTQDLARLLIATNSSSHTTSQPTAPFGKIAIHLDHVSRTYKNGQQQISAVHDISLQIGEGEIVAIMGPSGSGKSTLLNMIGGLEKPDHGEINIFDQRIAQFTDTELSHYRNRTIGFVFQFFYLQPYLSVKQNVEIPLLFADEKMSTDQQKIAIEEAITSVQLQDRVLHLPSQLSGGQMQRVAIARALVTKPRIILADEPTGNLDRSTGKDILTLLGNINKKFNTTMIIVTHDSEVASLAHRVLELRDGRIA